MPHQIDKLHHLCHRMAHANNPLVVLDVTEIEALRRAAAADMAEIVRLRTALRHVRAQLGSVGVGLERYIDEVLT